MTRDFLSVPLQNRGNQAARQSAIKAVRVALQADQEFLDLALPTAALVLAQVQALTRQVAALARLTLTAINDDEVT